MLLQKISLIYYHIIAWNWISKRKILTVEDYSFSLSDYINTVIIFVKIYSRVTASCLFFVWCVCVCAFFFFWLWGVM